MTYQASHYVRLLALGVRTVYQNRLSTGDSTHFRRLNQPLDLTYLGRVMHLGGHEKMALLFDVLAD